MFFQYMGCNLLPALLHKSGSFYIVQICHHLFGDHCLSLSFHNPFFFFVYVMTPVPSLKLDIITTFSAKTYYYFVSAVIWIWFGCVLPGFRCRETGLQCGDVGLLRGKA